MKQTLVVFQLEQQQYALPSAHVERISAMAELIRPLGCPALLAGFLNLAGEPVPVICLRTLFGLPAPSLDAWTPLVLLRGRGKRRAMLVDHVNRVVPVDDGEVAPLPAGQVLNEWVTGVIRSDDESILLLSPERLLLESENRAIETLQEMAQQRIDRLEAGNVSEDVDRAEDVEQLEGAPA